jgi:hypothetical protein
MFCNYCKSARPENEAPCPNCGAPSSLLGQFQTEGWGAAGPVATAWNAPATAFNQQWNNQGPQFPPGPQASFDTGQPWPQNPGFQNQPMPQQPPWSVPMMAPTQEQAGQAPQSLLPVPYIGPQPGNQQEQMQLVPFQQQMLPAFPDAQGETVYVPPLYTKPRPIIPRYRIISGILSIVIVSLLFCGGGTYLAQSKGLFTTIGRLMGTTLPANANVEAAKKIPDPPLISAVPGPAIAIIPSATTTSFIDQNSLAPREQDKIFQVGATFYVTYSAKAPKPGNVVIKWYMNGHYYKDSVSQLIDPKVRPSINGAQPMTYAIAASGVAEIYWQVQGGVPQLAQRLYFAVR